jgi:integrase
MTIRKRGDTWYVDISEKGKRRLQRAIKGARTRAQALKAEAAIRTRMFEKRYGLAEKPECRFDKFVEETFLPYKKLIKSYASIVTICKPLAGFFGKYAISEIDSQMIEHYKQMRVEETTIRGTKRSPLRVNKEIQVLSSIFTLAIEKELIASRPKINLFRVSGERIRYLTPDEEANLMTALDNRLWLKNIVLMALNTGMRRGEIFNLQWFDVDFERGLVHVRHTKSGKDRAIPMNSTVRALLEGLSKSSGYVFPSPRTGDRLVDIKIGFMAAVRAAKIKDFRFHDIRHCAATRMAEAGVDIFTLAAILGHEDIRMTKRYAHATDEAKRRAVEKLGQNQTPRDSNVTEEKGQARKLALNH